MNLPLYIYIDIYIYTYIHIYIERGICIHYIDDINNTNHNIHGLNLREIVYTHHVLAPGASEVWLGAAALVPLFVDLGGSADAAAECSSATFSAQAFVLQGQ